MNRINITNNNLGPNKKKLLSIIYYSVGELLKGNDLMIKIDKNVNLHDVDIILSDIAKIVGIGADMLKKDDDDDDDDDDTIPKIGGDGYDGWLSEGS